LQRLQKAEREAYNRLARLLHKVTDPAAIEAAKSNCAEEAMAAVLRTWQRAKGSSMVTVPSHLFNSEAASPRGGGALYSMPMNLRAWPIPRLQGSKSRLAAMWLQ
jgi:hypothetical protein